MIIVTLIYVTVGCKSNPEAHNEIHNQDEAIYFHEESIDDFCEVGRVLGLKMCQGKYEIKIHGIDTSEEALASLKVPSDIVEPTSDFIVGYKNGWKERLDNFCFFTCLHHRELSSNYTPMMRDNRNESDDYREGWELGWKKGTEDVGIFSDQLKKKMHIKGG